MAYVEVWDESKPAGSRDANLGDDDIREFKRALTERFRAGGMSFPTTDDQTAGLYNYLKFIEQSGNPSSEANRAFLFTKDVSGVTELYWMDSAGTVIQLTSGGKILITSLVISSEAQGDILYRGASAWSRLGAGTNGQFLKTQGAAANPAWADVGFQTAATQAEMEAASVTNAPVTPGRTQYHPGVAKAWCTFNGTTAGTNPPTAGHNVASVTRVSAGVYTITFTTAFSDANYVVMGSARENTSDINNAFAGVEVHNVAGAKATGTCKIRTAGTGGQLDVEEVNVVFFGDQA